MSLSILWYWKSIRKSIDDIIASKAGFLLVYAFAIFDPIAQYCVWLILQSISKIHWMLCCSFYLFRLANDLSISCNVSIINFVYTWTTACVCAYRRTLAYTHVMYGIYVENDGFFANAETPITKWLENIYIYICVCMFWNLDFFKMKISGAGADVEPWIAPFVLHCMQLKWHIHQFKICKNFNWILFLFFFSLSSHLKWANQFVWQIKVWHVKT